MTRRLTVLQVLPALHSGGVERGTLEIARALVAAGHRSIVVSNGGRLVNQLVREGSEHITMPVHRKSLKSLLQILPFRRLLRELKPDIVHARSRIPAWIAWLAWRWMDPATRPRFVTTVHGLYSVSPYSEIMTKGEVVIVVSDTVRRYVEENYPNCAVAKIRLIYRGVAPNEFPYGHSPEPAWLENWQQQFPSLVGKRVLALPGRISRVKGHTTFLDLICAVRRQFPDVHGLIIGGAESAKIDYEAELKTLVASGDMADFISFTGHRDDIRDVLSQCDLILALRTTPEAFGRSTLEPLRLGKPVIGWDVGGVGEILQALYPEGAVAAGNTEALHQRVAHWLQKPTAPADHGAFQLDDMTQKTLATYRSLVKTSDDLTSQSLN